MTDAARAAAALKGHRAEYCRARHLAHTIRPDARQQAR